MGRKPSEPLLQRGAPAALAIAPGAAFAVASERDCAKSQDRLRRPSRVPSDGAMRFP